MTEARTLADAAAQVREFIAFATRHHCSPPDGSDLQFKFQLLATSLFRLQFENNPVYRRFCEARNATPNTIRHWHQIPALPISAFKEFEVTSLPVEQRTRVFHSSGTMGQPRSRHFHSPESIGLYEASLLPWFRAHVDVSSGSRLVMLTPPPECAPHSSLAHMFGTLNAKMGSGDSVFTGVIQDDGSWKLDLAKTIAVLSEVIAAGQPVVLLGTAFLFVHLLDHLAGTSVRLQLPVGSRVLETGGYKGRSRELSRAELLGMIQDRLDVPPGHVLSEYGMSELSSQAYEVRDRTTDGSFRFPPWARVRIVSPETGEEVELAETGLIRVLDLANVYSVMAIQTEDLGVRRADGFDLVGRATGAETRGCSLMSV